MRNKQILKPSVNKTSSSLSLTSQKLRPFRFSQHLELICPIQILQSITESKQNSPSAELPSWRAVPPQPGHSGHLGRSPWLSARRRVRQQPARHSQAPHTASVLRRFCSLGRHIRSRNRRLLEVFHTSAASQGTSTGCRVRPLQPTAVQSLGGPRERVGGPQRGCLKTVFRIEQSRELRGELTCLFPRKQ